MKKIKKNLKNLNRLVRLTGIMSVISAAFMLHCCAAESFGWAFTAFGCAVIWFTAFTNFADIRDDYEEGRK